MYSRRVRSPLPLAPGVSRPPSPARADSRAPQGTLLHLLHAAREQDVKETLLCYAVVCRARAAGEGALGAAEVRARAEAALEGDFGLRHSAFDVEDALVKCEAILGRRA